MFNSVTIVQLNESEFFDIIMLKHTQNTNK